MAQLGRSELRRGDMASRWPRAQLERGEVRIGGTRAAEVVSEVSGVALGQAAYRRRESCQNRGLLTKSLQKSARPRTLPVAMIATCPAQFNPELTPDRMLRVAEWISQARREALASHDPSTGEQARSLGLRVLERLSFLLQQRAQTTPWLAVLEPGLQLRYAIGGVPFGVYRGNPNSPPGRTLKIHRAEAAAAQLSFSYAPASEADSSRFLWRYAVVTDDRLMTVSISIVLIDSSNKVCRVWDISPTPTSMTPEIPGWPVELPLAKGIILAPPVIGDIKHPDIEARDLVQSAQPIAAPKSQSRRIRRSA